MEFLRAKVINEVIRQVVDCFMDNEAAILAGGFDVPLLEELPLRSALDALIENARQRIYCALRWPASRLPVSGWSAICSTASPRWWTTSPIAATGIAAQPHVDQAGARAVCRTRAGADGRSYRRLLLLTDFVSGMTDSYAVSLYKKSPASRCRAAEGGLTRCVAVTFCTSDCRQSDPAVRRDADAAAAAALQHRPESAGAVVREKSGRQREMVLLRWGLIPGWSKGPDPRFSMINARSRRWRRSLPTAMRCVTGAA